MVKATAPINDVQHVPYSDELPRDPQGRLLRLDFSMAGLPYSLVTVYAPASDEQAARAAFFNGPLRAALPEGRRILLGGDFNCVLEPADRSGGTSRSGGSEALAAVLDEHGLVDVWRVRHPGACGTRHISRNSSTQPQTP